MFRRLLIVALLFVVVGPSWANADTSETAKAHLAFIKEQALPIVEVQEGFFGFMGNKDEKIVQTLLAEIDIFLDLYRDDPKIGEIVYLRSALLADQKEYEGQAIALLKLIYEYPESAFTEPAASDLAELTAKKLKDEAELLNEIVVGVSSEDRSVRYAAFISAITRFSSKKFLPWILAEYREFQRRAPTHKNIDQVIAYTASHSENGGDFRSAVYYYDKLIVLYPESVLRPAAFLSMGMVLSENLKSYDAALGAFERIYTDYPESEEVVQAYELSAQVQEEKNKDYPAAIEMQEAIVAKYPKKVVSLTALNNVGRIYNKRMKQYIPAIEAYKRITEMFPGDPAVTALIDARAIAGKSLKDYRLLVDLCRQQVDEYPDRDESAVALYELAETSEKRLKDQQVALDTYRDVAEKYPDHKLAEKAMKRVEKLLQ